VTCTATSDYDLRVDGIDMSDEKGEFPEEKLDELGALDFNDLDPDVQDSIYDFLHALHIDDSTATIVHHQNWIHKTEMIKLSLQKIYGIYKPIKMKILKCSDYFRHRSQHEA